MRADEQGDRAMVRTGRLRNAAMACGGAAAIVTAVIGLAGPAGWVRPAAARAVQAVPPGAEPGQLDDPGGSDESTATAPPAGTRPSSRADGSGSGPVGDLPGAGSDGVPIATGALAAAAMAAAVVAVRRSPSRR